MERLEFASCYQAGTAWKMAYASVDNARVSTLPLSAAGGEQHIRKRLNVLDAIGPGRSSPPSTEIFQSQLLDITQPMLRIPAGRTGHTPTAHGCRKALL